MLLSDLPSELPLLLLATADVALADLDTDALKLFGSGGTNHEARPPNNVLALPHSVVLAYVVFLTWHIQLFCCNAT